MRTWRLIVLFALLSVGLSTFGQGQNGIQWMFGGEPDPDYFTFAPGNPWHITVSDKMAKVWDESGRKLLRSFPFSLQPYMRGYAVSADLSHDGRWIAVGGNPAGGQSAPLHNIAVYDYQNYARVAHLKSLDAFGNLASIDSVSFSPDGRFLAACQSSGNQVQVWDTQTWQSVFAGDFTMSGSAGIIKFSPDSRHLLHADNDILVYRTTDWALVGGTPHSSASRRIQFDGVNNQFLVKAGLPDRVQFHSLPAGAIVRSIPTAEYLEDFAISKDGQVLARASQTLGIGLWNVSTGTFLGTFEGSAGLRWAQLDFSDDGSTLMARRNSSSPYLQKWDVGSFGNLERPGQFEDAAGMAVSTRTDLAAVYSVKEVPLIWLIRKSNGSILHTIPVPQPVPNQVDRVSAIDVQISGKVFATGTSRGRIHLWSTSSGALLRSMQQNVRVWSVDFSPKDDLMATTDTLGSGETAQQFIRLWRVSDGALIHTAIRPTPPAGHLILPLADRVLFTANGRYIVHFGNDMWVTAWDVKSRRWLPSFSIGLTDLMAWDVSPSGNQIATMGSDGIASLWSFPGGGHIRDLPGIVPYGSGRLTFSPDGSRIARASNNGVIEVFESATGNLVAELENEIGAGFMPVTWLANNRLYYGRTDGVIVCRDAPL